MSVRVCRPKLFLKSLSKSCFRRPPLHFLGITPTPGPNVFVVERLAVHPRGGGSRWWRRRWWRLAGSDEDKAELAARVAAAAAARGRQRPAAAAAGSRRRVPARLAADDAVAAAASAETPAHRRRLALDARHGAGDERPGPRRRRRGRLAAGLGVDQLVLRTVPARPQHHCHHPS